MKVLVVDDEPLARERLMRLLESEDTVTQCFSAANGQEALTRMTTDPVDLVLLDIRMPGISGLEVSERMMEATQPPAIVFCTAYDDYALDAFRVQAVSYLLKPVKREDLNRVLRQAGQLNRAQLNALGDQDAGPVLTLQTGRGKERIPLTDLYYFRADQKYVTALCRQGERLCDLSLKQLEERWPDHLVRVHRNTLVPKQRLEKLSRDSEGGFWLRLRGLEESLPVSRRFARELKPLFEG
ncbi:LytR/AlgR family response regulator transcription factor [Saccharospirillum salsuginis]|uniref:Positive alginate biosynthesis regulatory protein n=1 Tax=Saccharospirillum salsuginis TaxID=418750 RepID=A0A918N7N1_9GAMM|nr:LytTR family DNA-binding domain-containing protein [Saccharospirillum salsuginis]GGX44711.1 positive alginate biosynthesis regulatory protein [Saccharospirillum salsuginis]